jgi:hypothetical protein
VEEDTSLDRQRTGELEPTRGLLCPINVSSQQFVYQGLGLRLEFRKYILKNVNQLFDPHKDGKTNMCVCVCVSILVFGDRCISGSISIIQYHISKQS